MTRGLNTAQKKTADWWRRTTAKPEHSAQGKISMATGTMENIQQARTVMSLSISMVTETKTTKQKSCRTVPMATVAMEENIQPEHYPHGNSSHGGEHSARTLKNIVHMATAAMER